MHSTIFFSVSSGQALQELSKEKSSQKSAETQTQQFIRSLSNVESKLSEQINYLTQVSTGQPHEGSGYASAKVLQMAWHRIQHARSRVRELEESKVRSFKCKYVVLRNIHMYIFLGEIYTCCSTTTTTAATATCTAVSAATATNGSATASTKSRQFY